MTPQQKKIYEKTFKRPKNFFKLSVAEQWIIDEKLGISEWRAVGMNEEELKRYQAHYGL
jgi:hypothetical protein